MTESLQARDGRSVLRMERWLKHPPEKVWRAMTEPDRLADWFPGAALLSQAQHWKGARPMLPDGPPVLGASGLGGIWLNLGHGSSGWALACGSARIVADQLAGRPAAMDTVVFGVERLRS